jgi:hypothetical protein
MKQDHLTRHLIIGFAIALLLYLAGFFLIEHYRNVNGPWRVTFRADSQGQPGIAISHAKLSLSNVTLVFQGEQISNFKSEATILFDQPKTNVPFGKVLFLDTTFLPGTVTFDLFGHEIELRPRTMVVDLREVAWKSGATIKLSEKEKRRSH